MKDNVKTLRSALTKKGEMFMSFLFSNKGLDMKVKRAIIMLTVTLIVLLNITPSYASEGGYTVEGYDVHIIVTENNVLRITENIKVNFNQERHGIYREIPTRNKVVRQDGTESTVNAKLSNVQVNKQFVVNSGTNTKSIKIGSEHQTVIGDTNYHIEYNYDLGNDKSKDYDELYFNMIGTGWDVPIKNITFVIQMPKEFDEKLLGFTSGPKGSTVQSKGTKYVVRGNTIKGQHKGKVNPGEALTVRVELPNGYFDKEIDFDILFIALMSIVLILWVVAIKIGMESKQHPVSVLEFYPPYNLSPLDIARIDNLKVSHKDVTSLLIYLASQGYISIKDSSRKLMFGTKESFTLTKLREYDGGNNEEMLFMRGLFTYGNVVDKEDLENKFYTTVDSIVTLSNAPEKINLLRTDASKSDETILNVIGFIFVFLGCILPLIELKTEAMVLLLVIIPVLVLVMGLSGNVTVAGGKSKKSSLGILVYTLIFMVVFMGISLPTTISTIGGTNLKILSIMMVFAVICFIMAVKAVRRTGWSLEMKGRINGFREFLEVAERDRIIMLIHENPNYFYDIIPYAHVLGVTSEWIEKFDTLGINNAPDWYSTNSRMNSYTLLNMMDSTVNSSFSSSPSSSSSGSGGGSSGGGSGGGGGGSW